MDFQNGKIVRECLMPLLVQKHYHSMLDFSVVLWRTFPFVRKTFSMFSGTLLAGSYKLNLMRTKLIIPPRDAIFKVLCDRRQASIARVGLNFENHGGIMVGIVNIRQYLQLLLSRCAITKPMDNIILLECTRLPA